MFDFFWLHLLCLMLQCSRGEIWTNSICADDTAETLKRTPTILVSTHPWTFPRFSSKLSDSIGGVVLQCGDLSHHWIWSCLLAQLRISNTKPVQREGSPKKVAFNKRPGPKPINAQWIPMGPFLWFVVRYIMNHVVMNFRILVKYYHAVCFQIVVEIYSDCNMNHMNCATKRGYASWQNLESELESKGGVRCQFVKAHRPTWLQNCYWVFVLFVIRAFQVFTWFI